jgi:hypothetical protein
MEQCVIHFGYPKMHHMSHISVLFQYVGSANTFPTVISEWLHMSNVNERYQSTNKVKYIRQMLKYNNWSTGLDYMGVALSNLAQ